MQVQLERNSGALIKVAGALPAVEEDTYTVKQGCFADASLRSSGPEAGQRPSTSTITPEMPLQVSDDRFPGAGSYVKPDSIQSKILPEPLYDVSAKPMLTDKVQEALDWLFGILPQVAEENFVFVTRLEVSGFVDPEEDSQEVVVTEWVKVSHQYALDYWDRLCDSIEMFTKYIPEDLADILNERVSIEVRPD